MGVIVDCREPTKFRNFLNARGLEHTSAQLLTGDVHIFHDEEPEHVVVIERKRIDDLVSSYYSKRMGEQFERLSNEKFAVLIITGNIQDVLKNKHIPFNVMTQIVEEVISMAIIQYNFRTVVWMIDGVQDVHYTGFLTMVKCIEKVVAGKLDSIPEKKVKLSKDPRVSSLAGTLNIDVPTAKRLLKTYGTVWKCLNLNDSQYLSVKGIGPAKLKLIKHILHESINTKDIQAVKSQDKCSKCGNELMVIKLPGKNITTCKGCIGSV